LSRWLPSLEALEHRLVPAWFLKMDTVPGEAVAPPEAAPKPEKPAAKAEAEPEPAAEEPAAEPAAAEAEADA